MRWLRWLAIAALVTSGCSGLPPDGQPSVVALGVAGGAPNPLFVACCDPQAIWETVVDVVDNYFRVEREEPVRVIGTTVTEGRLETFPEPGATLLEPWRFDSVGLHNRVECTLQSVRRRAQVREIPGQGGFWIDMAVFKELEDAREPYMSTAGAATFHYDTSLVRVVNPIGEQDVTRGWIPYGRDDSLEQRMLGHIQARVSGYGAPFRIGANPQTPTTTR